MTRGLALGATLAVLTSAITVLGVASADAEVLAGNGTNLTAPSGIVQTPEGYIWVAQEMAVGCRLTRIARPFLVDSPWCGAVEHDEDEGPELDDDAFPVAPIAPVDGSGTPIGPASVSGLVFDAETDNFYVGDPGVLRRRGLAAALRPRLRRDRPRHPDRRDAGSRRDRDPGAGCRRYRGA